MPDVTIIGPNGVKATLHEDGSVTYPAGAGPTGRRAMGGMPPLPPSMRQDDQALGLPQHGAEEGETLRFGRGGYPSSSGAPARPVATPGPRTGLTQADIDAGRDSHQPGGEAEDPGARELAQQAMFMGALHLLGGGLSRVGQQVLNRTPGGRALETLRAAEANPEVGEIEVDPAARSEIERLRTREMSEGADNSAEIEQAYERGMRPVEDPKIAKARKTLTPSFHPTDLLHPQLAAMRNLAGPGAALTGSVVRGAGDLLTHPSVAFSGSPLGASLFDAVLGGRK